MRIMIATENEHKLRELREILPEHELVIPSDLGIHYSHEETGNSFLDNALGKAQSLAALRPPGQSSQQLPILADDSGICVDALGGAPGVYTARYGGTPDRPRLSAGERNAVLLDALKGVTNRDAHYVCCMVLDAGRDRIFCAQETWHGRISERPSDGRGGFGYDPVFFLPEYGVTAADIGDEKKHEISHRGKAVRAVARLLDVV